MHRTDDDIRWVKARQPHVEPPDPETTRAARAALTAHAERCARIAAVAATPSARARPGSRRPAVARSRRRGLAFAAVTVAAAAAAAIVAVAPRAGHGGTAAPIAPAVAGGRSLVLLADHVAAAPRRGDATLVFHRNALSGEGTFTGADLYLDNGRYYYAATPAGLPAAIQAGPQDFSLKPIVDAMAAAANADPQAARAAFLKAADPLYGDDVQHESAARQDNVIWVSSIDVLGAAYGRPAVLAGTLRALSTVHAVTVTNATYRGVPTLEIAMQVPAETIDRARVERALKAKLASMTRVERRAVRAKLAAQPSAPETIPAHAMRATVNAKTGALLRYTDIGLVETYRVSRVNAADYRSR